MKYSKKRIHVDSYDELFLESFEDVSDRQGRERGDFTTKTEFGILRLPGDTNRH